MLTPTSLLTNTLFISTLLKSALTYNGRICLVMTESGYGMVKDAPYSLSSSQSSGVIIFPSKVDLWSSFGLNSFDKVTTLMAVLDISSFGDGGGSDPSLILPSLANKYHYVLPFPLSSLCKLKLE